MQDKATLEDTLALMRDLRARCEWDAAQTHASLRPYLIEEANELDDALRDADDVAIREELGDLLLQVLFHAVVAEQRGAFDAGDVASGLVSKMRMRHPHLFDGGDQESWERMKARKRRRLDQGLASGLPSLHRAHRLQDRAAGVGFDWENALGPMAKVAEELEEVRPLLPQQGSSSPATPGFDALEAELGDLLFAVVNLCRKSGVHASVALDRANAKFVRRFTGIEELAEQRGIDVATAGLAALDQLWDEVKARE